MPYLPLALPPGIVRPGTRYAARGRWYDGSLVRWVGGVLRPIGGWEVANVEPGITDPGAVHAWISSSAGRWVAVADGVSVVAFLVGLDRTLTGTLFTPGVSGGTLYAVPTLDNFGDALVLASTPANGGNAGSLMFISESDLSTGNNMSVLTDGANNILARSVVVTPERFIFALGSPTPGSTIGGARTIRWADQESTSNWTADSTNQAGDFELEGSGSIMAGRRSRGETLIWTETDLWAARYIGGTLIYSFQRVGDACGAISRHSMVVIDGKAFWMGPRGFYVYDGFVRPIPCDVLDYLFGDPTAGGAIDLNNAHQVYADTRAQFNEVWWWYIDGAGDRRYVAYNYIDGYWMIGKLDRVLSVDAGVPAYPLAWDSNGNVYWHEVGDGAAGSFAESGPIELGSGDRVFMIRQIVPDEATLGDVEAKIFAAMYPTSTETTYGPFMAAEPTMARLTARQVRLRVDQVNAGWRFGTPRLEVVSGGLR